MQDKSTFSFFVDRLPNEIIEQNIAKCLNIPNLENVTKTKMIAATFFQSELNQQEAQKLLTHVVLGEEVEAQFMIEKNEALLLIPQKVVDYSGRTIVGTAFQAALGAGDKPMWKMMLPYLEQKEALRQFHEQFPNGIEETPVSELKAYYNAIALAIINDEDKGLSVIEGFRKEITSKKEIKQGKHFNLQHLIAAYQAYIDNFDALDTWNNLDLFWLKVIGYIQRQMTAYDAQIHCSGLKSVLADKNSFARRFAFTSGGDFFPLQSDAGLGFDFACYSYYRAVALWSTTASHHARLAQLENYVEQKQTHLKDLESHLSKECIISPTNWS